MVFGLILLAVLAVLLVLPLALWVALYRTRTRLTLLEQALVEQKEALGRLTAQFAHLKVAGSRAQPAEVAAAPVVSEAATRPAPVTPPVAAPPAAPPRPVSPPPVVAPPPIAAKPPAPPAPPLVGAPAASVPAAPPAAPGARTAGERPAL